MPPKGRRKTPKKSPGPKGIVASSNQGDEMETDESHTDLEVIDLDEADGGEKSNQSVNENKNVTDEGQTDDQTSNENKDISDGGQNNEKEVEIKTGTKDSKVSEKGDNEMEGKDVSKMKMNKNQDFISFDTSSEKSQASVEIVSEETAVEVKNKQKKIEKKDQESDKEESEVIVLEPERSGGKLFYFIRLN